MESADGCAQGIHWEGRVAQDQRGSTLLSGLILGWEELEQVSKHTESRGRQRGWMLERRGRTC